MQQFEHLQEHVHTKIRSETRKNLADVLKEMNKAVALTFAVNVTVPQTVFIEAVGRPDFMQSLTCLFLHKPPVSKMGLLLHVPIANFKT
jgi:hypothetical protein